MNVSESLCGFVRTEHETILLRAPEALSTNTTSNGWCVVKTFRNCALLHKDLRQQLANLG